MSEGRTKQDTPPTPPTDAEVERVAHNSGASKEQVEQLARATDPDTDLDDVAAAAARWS